MKYPRILLVIALFVSLFAGACTQKSIDVDVNPTGVVAKPTSKERFQYFRKPPADREYIVVAEVVAKTSSLTKAKRAFRSSAKEFKAQAAINIEAIHVGNYRGLAVNNWKAELIIWK